MPSGISSSSTSHTISGKDSVYMFPNTTPGKGPVTIIPQLYHRHVFGDYSGVSDKNIFGGAKAGRFYDQQIPFIGNNGFYSANYRTVSLLRCDLRWNFLSNQYLTGIVNYLEHQTRSAITSTMRQLLTDIRVLTVSGVAL